MRAAIVRAAAVALYFTLLAPLGLLWRVLVAGGRGKPEWRRRKPSQPPSLADLRHRL